MPRHAPPNEPATSAVPGRRGVRRGGAALRRQAAAGDEGPNGPGAVRRGKRLFAQGGLRLLTLKLLAEQPRHGYELIKAIEDLVGGEYSPSPGVIYPTLAYLADLGMATAVEQEGGRKQYAITAQGQAQLASQQAELELLLQRVSATRQPARARAAPEIQRAMAGLKLALQLRFGAGTADRALAQQAAALIDQAVAGIERL